MLSRDRLLVGTSLLSVLLLSLHITGDMVVGLDTVGRGNMIGVVIAVVLLCGALLLGDRVAGYIIMLLGGLAAAGMPVLHWGGTRIGEIVKAEGGFSFYWILFMLGITGTFSIILSVLQLWDALRRRRARSRTATA
jgi:hypothetical protein